MCMLYWCIYHYRLYWADSGLYAIKYVDLSTEEVMLKYTNVEQQVTFFGISIYGVSISLAFTGRGELIYRYVLKTIALWVICGWHVFSWFMDDLDMLKTYTLQWIGWNNYVFLLFFVCLFAFTLEGHIVN